MLQKQINVFIENKQGRLADITGVLGDNGIDMCAVCIADTADFGILRIIVDKPDSAEKILKDNGYAVSISEVIALSVEDRPGGLASALRALDACGINIEYMYAFVKKNAEKATVIIRAGNPGEAVEKLKASDGAVYLYEAHNNI